MRKSISIVIVSAALIIAVLLVILLTNNHKDKPLYDEPKEISLPTDADSFACEITAPFVIKTSDGDEIEGMKGIYMITNGGEYVLSGKLDNGKIVISAGNKDIVSLKLNGVSIYCDSDAPIYVENADSVSISAAANSYNTVIDGRAKRGDESDGVSAAIYSCCDLEIKGNGALSVTAGYNNGIQSKKTISVRNLYLKVNSEGNAIKGNDFVEIESGEVVLLTENGDGIKTKNSDESKKGKQRGNVTLKGGKIAIFSSEDGIDSAYDTVIDGECELSVFTGTRSDYGSVAKRSVFIIIPNELYVGRNYYVYAYDKANKGKWLSTDFYSDLALDGSKNVVLSSVIPDGCGKLMLYCFDAEIEPSLNGFDAKSDEFITSADDWKNGFIVDKIMSERMSVSRMDVQEQNKPSTSTASAKGIKANNSIVISGGAIKIDAEDDGINVSCQEIIESGKKSEGLFKMAGGYLMISSGDDAIHADCSVVLNDGTLNVADAAEGIEANIVLINGGKHNINAANDGINATKGDETPCVNVSGGYVEINVRSGDTDGIDSNGDYKQSGGLVIVKCASTVGVTSGSVDVDGRVVVTGGTIVAVGGICELPEESCNAVYMGSVVFEEGTYKVKDEKKEVIVEFAITEKSESCWIASDKFVSGTDYKITFNGDKILDWTQTKALQNINE